MLTIVHLINTSLTAVFDILFGALGLLSAFWSLAVFSVLTAVSMLWIYKLVSNQEAIRTHKNRITGNLLGVWLFQNELSVFFRLQLRILDSTLRYASHSFKPLCVILVPMALTLIQLDWRYGVRSFEPGEAALVVVNVENAAALQAVTLKTPEAIEVETLPIRIPSKGEVVWRIRGTRSGAHDLIVRVDDVVLTKRVVIGETTAVIPVARTSHFPEAILYPGEAPIEGGPVLSITVLHPAADIDVLGWRTHWLIPFVGLSVLGGSR